MKILEAGHKYELDIIDPVIDKAITLTFVKREGERYPFNKGKHPGTNVQEVLRAVIDRTRYLLHQQPCMETENALHNLESALAWYEVRAARCHGRVLAIESMMGMVSKPTCIVCGHVGCTQHKPVEPQPVDETLETPTYERAKFAEATKAMREVWDAET